MRRSRHRFVRIGLPDAGLLAASVIAIAIGACGGDEREAFVEPPPPEEPEASAPPPVPALPDAAPLPTGFLSTCEERGDKRAVLLAVEGTDELKVVTLDGGSLVDNGVHVAGINAPRRVAFRSDGAEAVVAWGNLSDAGLAVIHLAPDGSSASLAYSVDLGPSLVPYAVTYVGTDRVLFAGSSSDHHLVTLDRVAGKFQETVRTTSPGPFPFTLLGRDDSPDVLLGRVELSSEDSTKVQQVAADQTNAFVPAGDVAEVRPTSIDLVVHTSGKMAYTPTSDPDNAVSVTNLHATGVLQALTIDGGNVALGAKKSIPRVGSLLAIDPKGRFLVLMGNDYVDTGTPSVTGYAIITVPLEADGTFGLVLPETPPSPGLLFSDLKIAPSGHLLAGRVMAAGTAAADEEYPLELSAQTSKGKWKVCQRIFLSGMADIAIAPLKGSSVR